MYHPRERSRDLVSVSGLTIKLLLSYFEDETEQIVKKSPQPSPLPTFSYTPIQPFDLGRGRETNLLMLIVTWCLQKAVAY